MGYRRAGLGDGDAHTGSSAGFGGATHSPMEARLRESKQVTYQFGKDDRTWTAS